MRSLLLLSSVPRSRAGNAALWAAVVSVFRVLASAGSWHFWRLEYCSIVIFDFGVFSLSSLGIFLGHRPWQFDRRQSDLALPLNTSGRDVSLFLWPTRTFLSKNSNKGRNVVTARLWQELQRAKPVWVTTARRSALEAKRVKSLGPAPTTISSRSCCRATMNSTLLKSPMPSKTMIYFHWKNLPIGIRGRINLLSPDFGRQRVLSARARCSTQGYLYSR